jgi:hypothetical protein
MFRLVPFGPLTKIRNVCPAFADVKLKSASIRFVFTIVKATALIRVAQFARSSANTDVTFGTPLMMKHAPVINTSCNIPHGPLDGVTDVTSGALAPSAILQIAVRVNAPKMLLFGTPSASPAVKVVVTVIAPAPPQHAAGNPEFEFAPKLADTGIVAVIRLQLTGITFTNATTVSGVPSPFVSQANVAAVVTTFPGRSIGNPVSFCSP